MNIENVDELRFFLERFSIKKDKIDEYIGTKKVFLKFHHYYLQEKGLGGKDVFSDSAIVVQLAKKMPTKYLLNKILEMVPENNLIIVTNRSLVLDFVYGKTLRRDVDFGVPKVEGMYYIVEHNGQAIGYVRYSEHNGFENECNLGDYLREK